MQAQTPDRHEGERVLLTGASGFVGSAVARKLLARGYRVRVLLRPKASRENITGLDVEIVEGDLRQPESLHAATNDCTCLIHTAADYRLWVPDVAELYRTNVEGTVALITAAQAAGVRRIVYTSSVATLATAGPSGDPVDENATATEAQMTGHYKRSKWLAEQRVRELATTGVDVVIVNPSAPVGPRDVKPTPTGGIILDTLNGRTPAYVDTGLNIVHVDDVAEGHILALERGQTGRRYILGGENMTLRQILEIACRHHALRPPRLRLPIGLVMPVAYANELLAMITHKPPRVCVDAVRMSRHRMYYDSARAEHELGYRCRPAKEAITDAVDWFVAHGRTR